MLNNSTLINAGYKENLVIRDNALKTYTKNIRPGLHLTILENDKMDSIHQEKYYALEFNVGSLNITSKLDSEITIDKVEQVAIYTFTKLAGRD